MVISDVKAMTVRCTDFRMIHLAFMDSRQTARTVLSSPQSETDSKSSSDGIAPVKGEDVIQSMNDFKPAPAGGTSSEPEAVLSGKFTFDTVYN